MKERKFHLSVSLSPGAIDFVNTLGEKHFSTALEQIIMSYKALQPNHRRTEAVEKLVAAARTLSACEVSNEGIISWVKEAIRKAK